MTGLIPLKVVYTKLLLLDFDADPSEFEPITSVTIPQSGFKQEFVDKLQMNKETRTIKHQLKIYREPHTFCIIAKVEQRKYMPIPVYFCVKSSTIPVNFNFNSRACDTLTYET